MQVAAAEVFQVPDLLADVLHGAGVKALGGFHAAELAMIEAPVGNVKGDHLVIHVACVRGEDGHLATDGGVQVFRAGMQRAVVVFGDTVQERPGSGRQPVHGHGADVGVQLGPGRERAGDGGEEIGGEVDDRVALIGETGQVIFPQPVADAPLLNGRTDRIVDPVVAVGALQRFEGVGPVAAEAADEPDLTVQIEMEFMVAGPDLGILSETSRVAGLGEVAAAVFFNRDGKLFRPKLLHGRADVACTREIHDRISLDRFIADY